MGFTAAANIHDTLALVFVFLYKAAFIRSSRTLPLPSRLRYRNISGVYTLYIFTPLEGLEKNYEHLYGDVDLYISAYLFTALLRRLALQIN